jgi:2,3-bisphosphoglycerate-dependent phosphoglycerate mutase
VTKTRTGSPYTSPADGARELDAAAGRCDADALSEHAAGIDERGGRAASSVGTLTLLRHGESEFNRARRFTGWADVDLTAAGEAEARRAGETLARHGLAFERCFTSALRRAARTAEIVLHAMGLEQVPIERTWRLNERHYGALQGLGPLGALRRFGVLQVLRARRDYDYRPPALTTEAAPATDDEPLPTAESLADLRARIVPFWDDRIAPELSAGRSILVVSHKHALRALFGLVSGAGRRSSLRFATGVPIVVTLDAALTSTAHRALAEIRRR